MPDFLDRRRTGPELLITDKYLMKTYRAIVRVYTRGRTNYMKTEVRAESVQDARWLLWAQYGFHSIYSGPDLVNARFGSPTGKRDKI
jgi:hypothetical protein